MPIQKNLNRNIRRKNTPKKVFVSCTEKDQENIDIANNVKTVILNTEFFLKTRRRFPSEETRIHFQPMTIGIEILGDTKSRYRAIYSAVRRSHLFISIATKEYIKRETAWFFIEPALYFGFKTSGPFGEREDPPILIIKGDNINSKMLGGLLNTTGLQIKSNEIENKIPKFLKQRFGEPRY